MNGKIKYLLFCVGLLLMAFCNNRCANAVMPTGGPKDTTPPKVAKSMPENNSTGFQGKKIEISFDEYVTLENATQNILVSPPLKEKPDAKLIGKTLVIKFKEDLKPETTYNVSLGSCIRDLHESNVFENHVFTFSTGEHIDTLSIAGVVLNADDKKPVENVFVTLYDAGPDNLDSLPMLTVPNQIAKTGKDGRFRFNGLADKDYLVFALNDMNSNYFYDQPNENVAFIDSLVHAVYDGVISSDTAVIDTIAVDSIKQPVAQYSKKALDLTLYMFTKADTTQMVLEKKLVERGLLRFVFRQPDKNLGISYLSPLPDTLRYIEDWSSASDTLLWYFTPDAADSAIFLINDGKSLADTVKMNLKLKTKTPKPVKFSFSSNLKTDLLMPEDTFTLVFSEPVVEVVANDSLLLVIDSTTSVPAVFVAADSSLKRYTLQYDPTEGDSLTLILPDSVFIGIRGVYNEKKTINFHRAGEAEYGSLFITVIPPDDVPQIMVELLNEAGKVVDKQIVRTEQELEYWYLPAGKYRLRATLDADADGRWSSGDYSKRFQPEKVVEYKTALDVRAGWDIDLDEPWDLRP